LFDRNGRRNDKNAWCWFYYLNDKDFNFKEVSNLSGFFVDPSNPEFIEHFAVVVARDIEKISNYYKSI
jgi:hypothetical protein